MKKILFLFVVLPIFCACQLTTGPVALIEPLVVPDQESVDSGPVAGEPSMPVSRSIFPFNATNKPAKAPIDMPNHSGPDFNVWRSVGTIILVLAGLLAIQGFLKKRNGLRFGGGRSDQRIQFLEKLPIDHRKSVCLLEVDGQRVLIGVGPDRMDSLAVLQRRSDGTVNNEPLDRPEDEALDCEILEGLN